MKKILSVLMLCALVFTLSACGDKEDVFNWNIGADPKTLDPTLNGANEAGHVINQTFEGLVREISGEVYPGVAETWETSSDGLKITFHLRESKWSDGSALTAHDFVYSFKRGMDPATASEYSWIWEYTNIVGALDAVYEGGSLDDVGVEATDDYTLEISLTHPTGYFVSLMSFYHFMPVKKTAVEADGGADGLWAKKPDLVVCNGPFKLTRYTANEGLRLEKNDNYWNKEVVKLEAIEGKFIDEATTAYAAFNSGTLDFIPDVPPSEVARLRAEDDQFYVFPLLGTYYMNFNLNRPEWQNLKLRKALAYAIDREAIIDAKAAGEVPAVAFVPPGFLDHEGKDFFEQAGSFGIATDDSLYDEAVTLFAEAATEMGKTVQELKDYLDGKVILYNTHEDHQLVAEMIQESWSTVLGINVDLQNQEWAVFQETRTEGNYDIARGGWTTDFMDPAGLLAIFTTDNAYNDPKYSNTQFDQLMSEAQATTDATVHFEKLYEAQEILMNDMPIIPIYHYADKMYVKHYVKDWGRSVLGSLDFSRAYIDKD